MKIRLTDRSFLKLLDFTPEEIRYLLDLAHKLKEEKRRNKLKNRFKGKSLAMIFEKRSTRTRCAFETAFAEEGGHPVFLSTDDIQLGEKESVEDTARVLGRMFDAIQFRGFRQEHVEMLASGSGVPVYNGLTDEFHPTQILADFMTMEEVFGRLKGLKVVFVGDTRRRLHDGRLRQNGNSLYRSRSEITGTRCTNGGKVQGNRTIDRKPDQRNGQYR